MTAVFLSYAGEDALEGVRIHNDLSRTGLNVWGYAQDSRLGVDFQIEYREHVQQTDFFCLLDSAAARESPHVRDECRLAIERYRTDRKPVMLIGRIQRNVEPPFDWTNSELFDGHNRITYVDLTDYDRSIRRLCKEMRAVYRPQFELPRDLDFEAEVFKAVAPEQVENLIFQYLNYRRRILDAPEIAEAQLRVLVDGLERAKARTVIAPKLALGVHLGDTGRHREAARVFDSVLLDHPNEPRALSGKASAAFLLEEYELALELYQRCIAVVQTSSEAKFREHEPELLRNAANVLLELGQVEAAAGLVGPSGISDDENPHLRAMRGRVWLRQKHFLSALVELQQSYVALRGPSLPRTVVFDLAQCLVELGRKRDAIGFLGDAMTFLKGDALAWSEAAKFYGVLERGQLAVESLERAVALDRGNGELRVELAAGLWRVGQHSAATTHALESLALIGTHDRGHYYRGLALHILGAHTIAQGELELSRKNAAFRDWPDYSQILLQW